MLKLLNSYNPFLLMNILKTLLLSKKECLPPNKKGSFSHEPYKNINL